MFLFLVKVGEKVKIDIINRVSNMDARELITTYLKLRDEEDWGANMDEKMYEEKRTELNYMLRIIEKRGLLNFFSGGKKHEV